jgi:hypothetical protein
MVKFIGSPNVEEGGTDNGTSRNASKGNRYIRAVRFMAFPPGKESRKEYIIVYFDVILLTPLSGACQGNYTIRIYR